MCPSRFRDRRRGKSGLTRGKGTGGWALLGAALGVSLAGHGAAQAAGSAVAAAEWPVPYATAPGAEPFPPQPAVEVKPERRPGTVTIAADQPGVRLRLDGRELGTAPQTVRDVPVGDYVVEGVYSDGSVVSRPISVVEGDEIKVALVAKPAPLPELPAGAPVPLRWDQRLNVPTWVAATVAAAALVGGSIVGTAELSKASDYRTAPLRSAADEMRLKGMARDGRRLALTANILFGVGGAAGLVAAALAFHDLRKTEEAASWALAPSLDGESAGGTLRVRF